MAAIFQPEIILLSPYITAKLVRNITTETCTSSSSVSFATTTVSPIEQYTAAGTFTTSVASFATTTVSPIGQYITTGAFTTSSIPFATTTMPPIERYTSSAPDLVVNMSSINDSATDQFSFIVGLLFIIGLCIWGIRYIIKARTRIRNAIKVFIYGIPPTGQPPICEHPIGEPLIEQQQQILNIEPERCGQTLVRSGENRCVRCHLILHDVCVQCEPLHEIGDGQ